MRISSRSLLLKVQMYILSLWLLFVLLILASVDVRTFSNASFTWGFGARVITGNIPSVMCCVMLAACFICYFSFNSYTTGVLQLSVKIKSIENRNADFLVLLSTYIIPLITIDITSCRHAAILIVLLVVIGVMYVRTDYFLANPTLALIGYRVYGIELSKAGLTGVAITKDDLKDGDDVMYVQFGHGSFYVKKVGK